MLVEVIPHSDLAHEDLPARQMIDMQMLVVVDGKERSRVRAPAALWHGHGPCTWGAVRPGLIPTSATVREQDSVAVWALQSLIALQDACASSRIQSASRCADD